MGAHPGVFWRKYVPPLPRPFRERFDYPKGEMSKLLGLWFRPVSEDVRSKLDESIRQEIDEKGGWWAMRSEDLPVLFDNPHLEPDWPDMDRAYGNLDTVCRAFQEEGRLDLAPTDDEIQEAAGIAKARARGVTFGRPRTVDPAAVQRLAGQGLGASKIARQLGISRQSVYNAMQEQAT